MGGLFGGGGGGGSGTTAQQPQQSANTGNFQVFQPPGQADLAGLYQGLENQINNMGWSGLNALPGGVTAPTQLYPQVGNIAQNVAGTNPAAPNPPPGIPGVPSGTPTYAYGPYGNYATAGAFTEQQLAPYLLSAYNNANNQLGLGNTAAQNVFNNAYSPDWAAAISGVANNPYLSQAATATALQGDYGGATANQLWSQFDPLLLSPAQGLNPSAQGAAGTTAAGITELQGLMGNQGGLAPALSGQASALNPQLQQLYGQTVPGLQGLAAGLPGQAGGIGQQAQNLYGSLAPGYGSTAQGVQSGISGSNQNIQQLLSGLSPELQGLAGWGQSAAQTNTRNLQPLRGQAAASGAANTQALAPLQQWAQSAAQRNTGNINDIVGQTVPGIQSAAGTVSALGDRGGYGLNALPQAARSILQTGYDPQQALFNQQQQQLTDQSSAINAMSGLSSSPYGAGLTQNALSNFDINWQNQQLQRQATAGQAAAGMFGQAASDAATKAGIQAEGAGLLEQAGQFGLGAENQILQGKLQGGQQAANIANQTFQNQLASQQQQAGIANQILQGKLSGGQQAANILGQQGNLGLAGQGQIQSGLLGGGGLGLSALTGQGNLGTATEAQQLSALLGGTQGAGNLLGQAGNLGLGLNAGQLGNLTGAGNLYNQQAQGAGSLANTIGGLAGSSLQQQIQGQAATANQLAAALGLGGGLSSLAGQSGLASYNLQNTQSNALLQALQAQNQAGTQGAAALSALTGQQQGALQTGLGALSGNAAAQAAPYQTAMGQAQNALTGLTNQANFGNQLLNPAQQSLENILPYLNYGTNASIAGGNLGLAADAANQPNLSGIGSLLSAATGGPFGGGSNLLFGSGGLSGALGLNPSSGLFGAASSGLSGLFGGGTAGTAISGALNSSDVAAGFGDVATALGFF